MTEVVRNFVSKTDQIRVNPEAEVKDSAAFRMDRPDPGRSDGHRGDPDRDPRHAGPANQVAPLVEPCFIQVSVLV